MASSPEGDRYRFRFTLPYRAAGLGFGITPRTTVLVVTQSSLMVRFGLWRARTTLDNIRGIAVTGPYGFLKTAGPAHLGLTDHSLTFATNGEQGVQLSFHRPITGIEPTGLLRHPELTVTVADIHGLADRLRAFTA